MPVWNSLTLDHAAVGAQLKTKRLGSKDKTMCSFWLNTSFLEDGCTVLPKVEIDKCHQVCLAP